LCGKTARRDRARLRSGNWLSYLDYVREVEMFTKLSSADEVISLFEKYMKYMRQFFEIEDYESWFERGVGYVRRYGVEPNRHIYAVMESGAPIGFALVNDYLRFNDSGYAIAEFYVDDNQQKRGLGRGLAEHVLDQFPGRWEVAVARKKLIARKFWERVISEYTQCNYERRESDNHDRYGFTFKNA
jgi:predicted acetyltransferase